MRRIVKRVWSVLLLSLILLHGACSSKSSRFSEKDDQNKIKVVTTIAQIGEPLSVIGGDRVKVISLMGSSVDPHLYQATYGDMKTIDEAELIFYNGLHLEANMVDIFQELSKTKPVVGIGDQIDKKQLLKDGNNAVDPHIWFDINLWKQALEAAVEELKKYSPADADYFETNKKKYFDEMDRLKHYGEKLKEIPTAQRVLVTAHDAFGYLGRMYDLKVIGLQGLSTDSEIGVSDIQKTIEVIKKFRVPAVFIESSINDRSIQAVIEGAKNEGIHVVLGGELYSDAMGEAGTMEGTYLGMYRHNLDTIYGALMGGKK